MDHLEAFGIKAGERKGHEEVIYSIALIYNLLNNQLSKYLMDFNLTPAQFNVLMIIKHQGGESGISQVEISKRLIVTPSNMTRLIDKLESQKYIERFAQEGDRRVNIIKITEKGTKLLDACWPGYKLKLKELGAEFKNDADLKKLLALLSDWFKQLAD